jgi:hypothetical protein
MNMNVVFLRWGDYPEKLDPTYIEDIIESGTWFDNLTKFSLVSNLK